jgi:ribosomal protein S1
MKINKRNVNVLRTWLGCYEISKKRIFESVFCEKMFSLSLGIKYLILLDREIILYKKLYELKIIHMETAFTCIFFKFNKQKINKKISRLLKILNRIKKKKIFIKGRILNDIKGGFAVGSIGLICFLPKSRAFNCKVGYVYSFLIFSIDNYRHSFVLYRKGPFLIEKLQNKNLAKRVLKKLKAM